MINETAGEADANNTFRIIEHEAVIEAILFAAGEPVGLAELARAAELDLSTARALVENLRLKYEQQQRGINIVVVEDAFQMCTNPRYFGHITRAFGSIRRWKLTPAIMETLAIVAYKQPITKAGIEHIRGVNADRAVNRLMEAGLVQECGRLEAPGRPILLATTKDFLKFLGIQKISQLPELEGNLEKLRDEAISEIDKY